MEVKILSQENGMAVISVTETAQKLTKVLDEAYRVYAKNHENVPYTRETMTTDPAAQAVFRQAVQDVLSDVYTDAIRETGLSMASEPQITVLKADETEGCQYQISFAIRPEIRLGQYKGIHVKMPNIALTEEELQKAYEDAALQNAQPKTVDRPAQRGDIATIDFIGYKDNVPFPGGEGHNYPLTLGSGTFIPGFEDQLLGAKTGDHVAVNVTFPADYPAQELAGQATLFRVTINKLEVLEPAPLSEEQKQQVHQQAIAKKQADADLEIEDAVLTHILSEAQVEIPEAMLSSEVNVCMQQFASELQSQGIELNDYAQQLGKSVGEMAIEMQPMARRRIMLRLVLGAVAEAEQITATEEDLKNQWEQLAMQYGVDVPRLRLYMGEGADEAIRAEVINQKAYMLLRESTILDRE